MNAPDHQNLPSIRRAQLPDTYASAKDALLKCARVDECKEWADKAAAMASYAKQAQDDSLHKMAVKIRARAIRRAGELLKAIEPKRGGDRGGPKGGRPPVGSRKNLARSAGFSSHQAKQALRLASIPPEDFESAVESSSPPTVTSLASRGTQKKTTSTAHLLGATSDDYHFGTHLFGALQRFVERSQEGTPTAAARGERGRAKDIRANATKAIKWLDRLVVAIDKDKQCKPNK